MTKKIFNLLIKASFDFLRDFYLLFISPKRNSKTGTSLVLNVLAVLYKIIVYL